MVNFSMITIFPIIVKGIPFIRERSVSIAES